MNVDAWSMLFKENLNRTLNKLIPAETQEPEPSNELTEIVVLCSNISGFGECDQEDAQSWLFNKFGQVYKHQLKNKFTTSICKL